MFGQLGTIGSWIKRKITGEKEEFKPPELSMEGYQETPRQRSSGYSSSSSPAPQTAPSNYPPSRPPAQPSYTEDLASILELFKRDLETIKANLETINERLDKIEELARTHRF